MLITIRINTIRIKVKSMKISHSNQILIINNHKIINSNLIIIINSNIIKELIHCNNSFMIIKAKNFSLNKYNKRKKEKKRKNIMILNNNKMLKIIFKQIIIKPKITKKISNFKILIINNMIILLNSLNNNFKIIKIINKKFRNFQVKTIITSINNSN